MGAVSSIHLADLSRRHARTQPAPPHHKTKVRAPVVIWQKAKRTSQIADTHAGRCQRKGCCLFRGAKPTQRSKCRHDPPSPPASLGSCLSPALRFNRLSTVEPSSACNLDARQSGSRPWAVDWRQKAACCTVRTLRHSSDGQGQAYGAHLGAANVTSACVCHRRRCRCRRRRRRRYQQVLSCPWPNFHVCPWSSRPRAQTIGPLPHPSHAGRAHRPCTHSYPSVPAVPTPVLVSRGHWGSGQRQRHRAHDPWRSCMRTSFPAIQGLPLIIITQVLCLSTNQRIVISCNLTF